MVLCRSTYISHVLHTLVVVTALGVMLGCVSQLYKIRADTQPPQQQIPTGTTIKDHSHHTVTSDRLQPATSSPHDPRPLEKQRQPQPPQQACVQPKLDMWNPSLRMLFQNAETPELHCADEADWVFVENGNFRISQTALKKHRHIHCKYRPHIRLTDWDEFTKVGSNDKKDASPLESDAFNVLCVSSSNALYGNIHLGVAYNEEAHKRAAAITLPKDAMGLDVVIIGFNSMSKMDWMRNLPETHDYLVNELDGIVLENFNIVGDGTAQFLFPMLTGHHPEELPESRKGFFKTKPLDRHPWIWKHLKQAGYVTQLAEDETPMGAFTSQFAGFKEQPTDHYGRPFWHMAEGQYGFHRQHCFGSTPRHVVMLNYIRGFFTMYQQKPKWSLSFHTALSRNKSSGINMADEDLTAFLKSLRNDKYQNTLVIMMGDHRIQLGEARQTVQGRSEERLPYVGLIFPTWFKSKYPEAYANLKTNAHRLVTPFDIHRTFHQMLHYTGSVMGNASNRAISLFDEIPLNRTCSSAHIAIHWCACLKWQSVSTTDHKVRISAHAALASLNRITRSEKRLCAVLELKEIKSAAIFTPQVAFANSESQVGTEKQPREEQFCQVTVVTTPGDGVFEVTVTLSPTNTYVSDKAISRVNAHRGQAHCVVDSRPHLVPYCFCRK